MIAAGWRMDDQGHRFRIGLPFGDHPSGGPVNAARRTSFWDRVVDFGRGVVSWVGDLTGFDNGGFNLSSVGLNRQNGEAVRQTVEAVGPAQATIVVTATRPARQAWNDFWIGWNTVPTAPRREATLSATPAYIPVWSEGAYRSNWANNTIAQGQALLGQRSVFNSEATNFGITARAWAYGAQGGIERMAVALAPVDATFGRGIEAVHPYMSRYQASEGLANAASVMTMNPEALAAGLGPRARALAQTGARSVLNPGTIEGWDAAELAYDSIRASSTDVAAIARNSGISESRIARIKDHIFFKEHQLDTGLRRFDADPDIVNAWSRLEVGDHVSSDVSLLRHEIFESRFESLYRTNYRTAHEAAIRSGRTWQPGD
jgi:hypothetical protein